MSKGRNTMKNKIFAIIACAALLMTTACSKSGITSSPSDSSAPSDSSPGNSASTPSSTGSTTDPTSENGTPSAPEISAPESSDGSDTASGFVHGKQGEKTYISAFLGLKAEFADGWTMQTEEVLAAANGIADMSDENANSALDKNAILYELIAALDDTHNVNIVIENLNLTNGGKSLTAEEYIDLAIGGVESQFKAQGITEVSAEKSTASFLGSEAACMNTRLANEGRVLYQKMFPVSRGGYMGIVTFTSSSEEELNAAIDMFKSV